MKHAFLVIAHNAPVLLERIISQIDGDNHYIYLNIDKKADLEAFSSVLSKKRCNDIVLCRNEVNWGGFSQIACEVDLLKRAYEQHPEIDYYHLISGHDYLCTSMETFELFFSQNVGKSFMHFDSEEEVKEWRKQKYRDRVMPYHFNDWNAPFFIKAISSKILGVVKPRKPISNIRAGWNWFSWHRSLVQWVLNYLFNNPDYLLRFHYTSCCDEVVFQTLLYPYLAELNIVNNSLRYIDWHPKREAKTLSLVLNESDFDSIVDSKCLFCRKVNEGESDLLLEKLDGLVHSENTLIK